MNPIRRPVSCGCGRSVRPHEPPRPPRPEPCVPPPGPPMAVPMGGYLMQRVIACGRLCRRHACYPLCLSCLPEQAQAPFQILEVSPCGQPWCEDMPGGCVNPAVLRAVVPIQVRLRDREGCMYAVSVEIREDVLLRWAGSGMGLWQGQPYVQASVRLAGRPCPCERNDCQAPLDVMIEGYLLSSCLMPGPEKENCPPPRPWYPQPSRWLFPEW